MTNNNQEELKKRLENLPSPASPFEKVFKRMLLIFGFCLIIFLLIILILLFRG